MAFEGINFGMLPQSEMAQQNQFLQMIGQGIANYQAGQDRKLRERQLEYEMSKGSPMDYKQAAMDELYRMQTTGQTTPQGQAALQVMSQTTAPRQYVDPLTNQIITQPSPWQSLVGGQMTNADGVTRQQMADRSTDVSSVTPDILDYPVDVQGTTQPSPLNNTTALPGFLQGTRGGEMQQYEEKKELSKEERAFQRQKELKKFEKDLASEDKKAELFASDQNAIPLIKDMIKFNRQTIDMPYADLLKMPTRLLSSDQAKALDLVNQNRLELAAPLAKALGVNPTDKDFQASLDRIVDLNAGKESREAQLKNLLSRIEGKLGIEPQKTEFMSVEEAEAANLPVGTEIMINGRRAIVR